MKTFLWRTFEDFPPAGRKVDYINDCCRFCDVILERIKAGIAEKRKIAPEGIVIGQEDWGWYLELKDGEILYILSISYEDKDSDSAHNFGVRTEAFMIRRKFIFDRKSPAEKEGDEFACIVNGCAEQNRIAVSEE